MDVKRAQIRKTFLWAKTKLFCQSVFTMTKRHLARWLVKSYGLEQYRPCKMTWFWRNLCLFFLPRNFNGNGCRNCQCYCKKNKQTNKLTTIFHGLFSTIDWRQNVHKTLQWNTRLRLKGSTWVLNNLMLFLWSIGGQIMKNFCRFLKQKASFLLWPHFVYTVCV